MRKVSIGMALFTGIFVGIMVFLSEYLIPNTSLITSVIIAGLSALIGGLIGNKLFPNKSWIKWGVVNGREQKKIEEFLNKENIKTKAFGREH